MVDSIIYSSRATAALTDTELDVILLRSRTLNASRGITGALLKHGDDIVQYLEGDAVALARTLPRIQASPFHCDVVVLATAQGVQRQFDAWHMGFHEFQRAHRRRDDTAQWASSLPSRDAIEARNEPLLRLVAAWATFGEGRSDA